MIGSVEAWDGQDGFAPHTANVAEAKPCLVRRRLSATVIQGRDKNELFTNEEMCTCHVFQPPRPASARPLSPSTNNQPPAAACRGFHLGRVHPRPTA